MNEELLSYMSDELDAVDSYFDNPHFEDAVFSTEADTIHTDVSMEELHTRLVRGMSEEIKSESLRKIGNYCFSNLQDFSTERLEEIF